MNRARVPLIDIEPFFSGDAASRRRVGKEIGAACADIGFFSIAGHRVDPGIVDDLRCTSHEYFALPDAEKRECVHPVAGTPRGLRVYEGEALGRAAGREAPPDLKEFYHFGREAWPDDPYYTGEEGKAYFIPNIWPDRPAGFRRAANAYYAAMEELVGHLMRLAALALDLDEDWFEDKIDRHVTAMRINHYPPQPVAPTEGQIRAGAHTDFGTFTILMGEDEPGGLQVQDRDGRWYDVETRPETFVVNVGDLFRRWTNDVWTSNFHRVVNPPAEIGPSARRISIGFFHQPNYDAEIACLPTCTDTARPPLYRAVTSGAFRDIRYDETDIPDTQAAAISEEA